MATAVSKILDHLRDGGRSSRQGHCEHRRGVSRRPSRAGRAARRRPVLKRRRLSPNCAMSSIAWRDFYTPDETRLWLHARHPMLHNARAIDLINAGRTEEVLAVIEALDAGADIPECPSRRARPATCNCWTRSTRHRGNRCADRALSGKVATRCPAAARLAAGATGRSTFSTRRSSATARWPKSMRCFLCSPSFRPGLVGSRTR